MLTAISGTGIVVLLVSMVLDLDATYEAMQDTLLILLPITAYLCHAPQEVSEVAHDFQRTIDQAERRHVPLGRIERRAFYERAKRAYAIVATGETRPYGCILLVKGVVLSI